MSTHTVYTKVIGGNLKGKLIPVYGKATTSVAKKGTFSSLLSYYCNNLNSLDVLDAFAGSGTLGIEAISRGVRSCDFIDINPSSCKAIKDTMCLLNLKLALYKIYCSNVLNFKADKLYDLILVDPPFTEANYTDIIKYIINNLCKEGAIIAIHSNSKLNITFDNVLKERVYRGTKVSYIKA